MKRPWTMLVIGALVVAISACDAGEPGGGQQGLGASAASSSRPYPSRAPSAPPSPSVKPSPSPSAAASASASASESRSHPVPGSQHPGASVVPTTGRPVPHRRRGAAARRLARLSERQLVGQLFMVGTPAARPSRATRSQIRNDHVGNIILTGRSRRGIRAVRRVVAVMQHQATPRATARVPLLVATDQEGGAVQVLQGRGISHIPAAVHQGRWSLQRLSRRAGRWASQLRSTGVNMNLAPVVDTVPGPRAARHNAPVGAYAREYGSTTGTVSRHAVTFARAMVRHGVAPTAKHFPGLGRVRRNTDYSARVTDRTTRRHDPYLAPFRKLIRAGVPFVMVSTAAYQHLDPGQPAAFSGFVIRTILRHDLGFRGVVVSDDLAEARQVARWSYGRRAVKFLAAGGDLVLVTSPRAFPAMYDAVLHRARHDRAFRAKVHHAALLILRAKQRLHLLR